MPCIKLNVVNLPENLCELPRDMIELLQESVIILPCHACFLCLCLAVHQSVLDIVEE